MPPYFYPERQPLVPSNPDAVSQGISPLMTIGETSSPVPELKMKPQRQQPQQQQQSQQQQQATPSLLRPQPQRMKLYPGYYQQQQQHLQNAQIQMQQQQQHAQEQRFMAAAVATAKAGIGAVHPSQKQIDTVLNSFKVSPTRVVPKSSNEVLPHIARMKKEEEDMDEDERLLASEEGKKLSSKERRQLRNKVSARAFRSRRKGLCMPFRLEITTAHNADKSTRIHLSA